MHGCTLPNTYFIPITYIRNITYCIYERWEEREKDKDRAENRHKPKKLRAMTVTKKEQKSQK